ncbi:hypothetical protein D9757_012314 [Collybiopsis confluens]|uniref:AB hydrolase-1 domain-containing protein n=1 Tax=Collybiopsis confluens TaxID=2823264 RepID=A0A8H5GAH9_9AGAR|nr:hypothetical protein D9757_012314 [Collybiopsis confluens]
MASNHRTYTYTLSDGVQLSLTDGGPPPNSKDYTTVFVIHGTAFNAYQFRKLHQHAHFFNLRTVALHRRDYAGSTPYTHTELEEIQRGDRVFWDRLSAQLAEVLNVFIERENIPKLTVIGNRRSGGIAIMGWSFGCTTLLSLLGSAENPRISNKLCDLLEQYIGECVLYDPPYQALGYPLPSDNPNQTPWLDSTLSLLELPPVFTKWIGSYFDHRCYDPSIKSLSATATIHDLDGARLYSDKEEDISTTSWTEDDLIRGIEREAGGRDTLLYVHRIIAGPSSSPTNHPTHGQTGSI